MMPATVTFLWLILTIVLFVVGKSDLTRGNYRLATTIAVGIALLISFVLVWTSVPSAMVAWGSGLTFDCLGLLLLPSLWTVLGVSLLFSAFTDVPRSTLPLIGFMGTITTAGLLSSNALFLVVMLQAGTLVIILGLFVGIGSRSSDAILRIATSLKYITLSVVSAATLVVALLLASFYAINQDRVELPRIIVSLLLVGFGLSVAAFPFYFHLPDLFDAAPPVISALLVGPLQTMAFVYLIRTFENGPWLLGDPHVTNVLALGGLGGALAAGIMAYGQTSLNRVLALTSVQEVGWIVFGLGSATVSGWTGALAFLSVRLVAKPLLVLAVGAAQQAIRERGSRQGVQLFSTSPAVAVTVAIGAMSLVGFPLTAGFWGLKPLFQAAGGIGGMTQVVFVASVLLAFATYLRIGRGLFGRPEKAAPPPPRHAWGASAMLAAAAAGVVVVGLVPSVMLGALSPVFASLPFLR